MTLLEQSYGDLDYGAGTYGWPGAYSPGRPWPYRVRLDVQLGLGVRGEGNELWDGALWDRGHWSGVEPEWISIRCDVMGVHIQRGRHGPLERFPTSTCTITVSNETGRYSWRPAQPGVDLEIRPGRPVRVVALDLLTGAEFHLWRGFLERVEDSYVPYEQVTAELTCLDGLAQWALVDPEKLLAPINGGQTVPARIDWIADLVDWPPEWRWWMPSTTTVTATDLGITALELAQDAADAEGGAFYADTQGIVRSRNRDWLRTDPVAATVQARIDDRPDIEGHICAVGFEVTGPNVATVHNDIVLGRDNKPVVHSYDNGSVAMYQRRTYTDMSMIAADDAQLSLLTTRRLEMEALPRPQVNAAVLDPVADPHAWDLILPVDYGWRVAVHYSHPSGGWAWDVDSHVHGIEHVISPEQWTTRLTLYDATYFAGAAAWDLARWDRDTWSEVR